MKNCWANHMGNCDDQISGEHLVSEGILELFDDISVHGFPWCKDPKQVGIKSLKANHLCRKHNSDLSSTDSAACVLFKALRNQFGAAEANEVSVNCNFLERWFLKTGINLSLVGARPSGGGHPQWPEIYGAGEPPIKLVKIAFGRKSFTKPAGLYFHMDPNHVVEAADLVEFTMLSLVDNKPVAFQFGFGGLIVVLWLDTTGHTTKELIYRPREVNIVPKQYPPLRIKLM